MRRSSGIFLHITSLPSYYGIGDLGKEAYKFVDFLRDTKQSLWQILPLNPTESFYANSPYHGTSAFAGNIFVINPELLLEEGLLERGDLINSPQFSEDKVDFESVIPFKKQLYEKAFNRFKSKKSTYDFEEFCSNSAQWLEDFALFVSLKDKLGKSWGDWPEDLRDRDLWALNSAINELSDKIQKEKFLQYIFDKQWKTLKRYSNERGIRIIGDIPIYVDYDSADAWTNPELFKLDENKRPYAVSGVPPDYFSATGQLWGNPVYDWEKLQERGYDWWIKRFERALELTDIVRIDHFRGLVAYWEVPSEEKTAVSGKWINVPTYEFFEALLKKFVILPVIAEDLGIITPDVKEVMKHFGFPGMKVLLFAFGDDNPQNPYLPHMYEQNCVAYTGTHDNNTVRGWFEHEATEEEKRRVFKYLGHAVQAGEINWEFIRLIMDSAADTVIIPIQDVIGLGVEARINTPGTVQDNWRFRFSWDQVLDSMKEKLLEMTKQYRRDY